MQLLNSLIYMLGEMSPYVLLGFLIAGLMHAFLPQQAMARHLAGTGLKPVTKAALFGIPLPLCSCGVLPTAISMRRQGASKAASTSFLIATPQTGVDSIAATWSLLGPAFAVVRPVAALVTSLFGGLAVGHTERKETAEADSCNTQCATVAQSKRSFGQKCLDALRYGFIDLLGSIGGWLTIGLIIAALITVYVPNEFFGIFGNTPILSMIAVLIIAIPMYVCATGSIPIALSLMMKGLSPGTALVLLMAGPAANFASFTLISREMGRRSAIVYIASIIVGAMTFGLIIDYLLPASWFTVTDVHAACHHMEGMSLFPAICSVVLVALLIFTFVKSRLTNRINSTTMTKVYKIKGMNCQHCRAAVEKAIKSVDGVDEAVVDLQKANATVNGTADPAKIIEAVRNAGFDAEE